jgi:predicted ArsR family transcriptional regulator
MGFPNLSAMNPSLLEGAKKELLEVIKREGELSIDDATSRLRLAKTTVRQHLLHLEKQGLIERKYLRVGQGRPKVVFALSESGQRLYPSQDPELLRELLEYLEATGKARTIESFFEAYWNKRKTQFEEILAATRGNRDETEARINALRILLEREGFMPKIEKDSGKRIVVRECNCPFPQTIRATQLPCKLESDFIQWALKVTLQRTGYLPGGDSACTYSQKTPRGSKIRSLSRHHP